MPRISIGKKIGGFILAFILSIFLFPELEKIIISSPSFPLKNIFLFLIPSPQDNILEFLQFIFYWIGAGYISFREDFK